MSDGRARQLMLVGVCAAGALACLPLACRQCAVRSEPMPARYLCQRAREPIVIDGELEPAWYWAAWTDDFVDIAEDVGVTKPAVRPLPRWRTRVKMLWDDQAFYVAAMLEEPHVWGTLTHHDDIVFHDNDFEVFIDPDGDSRAYYEIEVNALNTVFDLFLERMYRDGGPAHHEWNVQGLRTAVHVDGTLDDASDVDRGWSVEMAIPWSSFGAAANRPCPPAEGDVWRVNFSRVEWRHVVVEGHYQRIAGLPEDNWVWSPQGVIDMHLPRHWGYVTFAR